MLSNIVNILFSAGHTFVYRQTIFICVAYVLKKGKVSGLSFNALKCYNNVGALACYIVSMFITMLIGLVSRKRNMFFIIWMK